jgi:hypothetical protein
MKEVIRNNDAVYHGVVAEEYLLQGNDTVSDLPTGDVPVGSVAYNAALTVMYMFDGTEWQEIGGGE